jgi:hypothetical protein
MQLTVVAVLRTGLAISDSISLAPFRRRAIKTEIDKPYGRRKHFLDTRRGFPQNGRQTPDFIDGKGRIAFRIDP